MAPTNLQDRLIAGLFVAWFITVLVVLAILMHETLNPRHNIMWKLLSASVLLYLIGYEVYRTGRRVQRAFLSSSSSAAAASAPLSAA